MLTNQQKQFTHPHYYIGQEATMRRSILKFVLAFAFALVNLNPAQAESLDPSVYGQRAGDLSPRVIETCKATLVSEKDFVWQCSDRVTSVPLIRGRDGRSVEAKASIKKGVKCVTFYLEGDDPKKDGVTTCATKPGKDIDLSAIESRLAALEARPSSVTLGSLGKDLSKDLEKLDGDYKAVKRLVDTQQLKIEMLERKLGELEAKAKLQDGVLDKVTPALGEIRDEVEALKKGLGTSPAVDGEIKRIDGSVAKLARDLSKEIEEAKALAREAKLEADKAGKTAGQAKTESTEAKATAEEAMRIAEGKINLTPFTLSVTLSGPSRHIGGVVEAGFIRPLGLGWNFKLRLGLGGGYVPLVNSARWMLATTALVESPIGFQFGTRWMRAFSAPTTPTLDELGAVAGFVFRPAKGFQVEPSLTYSRTWSQAKTEDVFGVLLTGTWIFGSPEEKKGDDEDKAEKSST